MISLPTYEGLSGFREHAPMSSLLRVPGRKLKGQGPLLNDHQISVVDLTEESEVSASPTRSSRRSFDIFRHIRRKSPYSIAEEREEEIDLLYENQRGAFLFGIPLFSSRTLLNFDPSPWVDRFFEHSPVNIITAQLPDPSWEWAWDQWYVDMSGDVDHEGWMYNFAFHNHMATWHGNKVWFHSFVRRRRWLRKRRKRSRNYHGYRDDTFTIGTSGTPHSMSDFPGTPEEEPTTYTSLVRALKNARLDREKLDLVSKFLVTADVLEVTQLADCVCFFSNN